MAIDNNTIDAVIAISMAFMAVSLMLLVATLMSVLMKGADVLGAVLRLCNTANQEMSPTLALVRELMESVIQIKGATTQQITAVGSQVQNVKGNLTTAVDKAHKESSVVKAGLLAGLRAYLSSNADKKHHEAEIGD